MRNFKICLFIGFLGFSLWIVNRYSLWGYEEEKRNPFIPLVSPEGRFINLDKESKKTDLLVEGTVFDKFGRSYAIVNGTVVEVGDTVAGFRVLKIEQEKVTFMKDGQVRVVEIKPEEEEK